MFEKSLNDLVRGIRAHKSNEASPHLAAILVPFTVRCIFVSQPAFIGQCMVEIKKELKQENMGIKCNAIAKLIYVSCLFPPPSENCKFLRSKVMLSHCLQNILGVLTNNRLFHILGWLHAHVKGCAICLQFRGCLFFSVENECAI